MYGRAHAQRICLKLYLQSGRMIVLKEWCAGGLISTKKELSHTISPKESSNNDRSVPRKRSGESQNYSKKKLIVKKPLERDGVGGNITLT